VRGDRGADDGPRECGGCAVDRNGSADGRTLSAWEWEETCGVDIWAARCMGLTALGQFIYYFCAAATSFFIIIKIFEPYPRIGVFWKIAYPRIRYVSYPIPILISVPARFLQLIV
jgi:hypothetical protein